MQSKLTHRTVQQLKPAIKPYEVVDTELKGFLVRVQPSGVMTYYLSYRTDGKRQRYKIARVGAVTPMQARDVAQKLYAKVVSGANIQTEKKYRKIEVERAKIKTLLGFLEHKYGPWVIADRSTGVKTLRLIRFNFCDFLPIPLSEIKPALIEKWRTEQLNAGKKAATINRDVTRLKAALTKAVTWEILTHHPLLKLKPLSVDVFARVRYLSTDEEKRLRITIDQREQEIKIARTSGNQWRKKRGYKLLPALNKIYFADYLKPMILISLNTGLRHGELLSLKWQNVNFENKLLTIDGSSAKSKKTKHIPLNSEAFETLYRWHKQSENTDSLVFLSQDGRRFNNIRKSWQAILTKAKIKDFRWHDMRHHFASKLTMANVDLNTVRELLGHTDLTMTLRYAHLAPEHKARAVEKLIVHK